MTDHRPLLGLLTTAEPNSQQCRWLMAIQDHTFTIRHRAGVAHTNADVLSRFPEASEADTVGARMDSGPLPAMAPPNVVMPDGQTLSGEEAAATMGEGWQQDMLKERAVAEPIGVGSAIAMCALVLEPFAGNGDMDMCLWGAPDQPPSMIDDFAPRAQELAGTASNTPRMTPLEAWPEHQPHQLASQATQWVTAAAQLCPDSRSVLARGGMDTSCCAHTFFPTARRAGITLFEPFGGLGAGLEMVLAHGMRVNRYVYCDTRPAAQAVMQHRLTLLSGRYPELLALDAWAEAFITLPADVYKITQSHIQGMTRRGEQTLLVAGRECQDLSLAGSGKGL